MEFKNKHSNYYRLRGVHHLEADTKLLQQLNPDARILRRLFEPDKVKLQGDILWALLDLTTPEEIEKNRPVEPLQKLPSKGPKLPKGKKTKPSSQTREGGKKEKAATKESETVPEERQTVPEEKVTAPETETAEGEKKDTPADKGAGVPADQLGESGESGHSEGNDSV